MHKVMILAAAAMFAVSSAQAQTYLPCLSNPYGSCGSIYDSQGVYRGELSSNRFNANSISNPFGRYGSQFSADSLNNPYGAGNPFLIRSPYYRMR